MYIFLYLLFIFREFVRLCIKHFIRKQNLFINESIYIILLISNNLKIKLYLYFIKKKFTISCLKKNK